MMIRQIVLMQLAIGCLFFSCGCLPSPTASDTSTQTSKYRSNCVDPEPQHNIFTVRGTIINTDGEVVKGVGSDLEVYVTTLNNLLDATCQQQINGGNFLDNFDLGGKLRGSNIQQIIDGCGLTTRAQVDQSSFGLFNVPWVSDSHMSLVLLDARPLRRYLSTINIIPDFRQNQVCTYDNIPTLILEPTVAVGLGAGYTNGVLIVSVLDRGNNGQKGVRIRKKGLAMKQMVFQPLYSDDRVGEVGKPTDSTGVLLLPGNNEAASGGLGNYCIVDDTDNCITGYQYAGAKNGALVFVRFELD